MKYCLWITLSFSIFAQTTEYPKTTHYHEPGTEPRERFIDIEKMRLDVRFDVQNGIVKGKVTHYFRSLRKSLEEISFDGVNLTILDAALNGKSVEYTNTGNNIILRPKAPLSWNSRDSVTITYEARPRKGIYFVGWNDPTQKMRRQIWTQGEDTDHRYWIPMYDEPNDKVIHETIITFDKDYRVIANGRKVSERENKDGTKTWYYAMSQAHAPYLLMIAIGKYDVKSVKSKSGLPMQLWYYPDQPDRLEPTFGYSVRAMDFLEEAIGLRYPWETFANIPVADFVTGAMENTTAVLTGDFWFVDARAFFDDNYIDTDFHEQAHQWFGDMITMRVWKHLWLQESFATYYAKKGCQKYFGEDYYQWTRREEQNSAVNASSSNRLPIVHTQAGTSRYYPKGSAVIDMMAYVWGEEAYKRVIYHFLSHHRFKNVETNDLYQSFQDTLGVTPDWFFDQWLYRGGEPEYEVSFQESMAGDERHSEFTVRQIHTTDEMTSLFKMPIVFEVHYQDGTKDSVREWIDGIYHKISIPNAQNKPIDFVLFDPAGWITKTAVFLKNFDMLSAQALRAPNMIDRYDAVAAMRPYPAASKLDLFTTLFKREKFHAIKAEVVSQLVNDPDPKSQELIRAALRDRMPEVRKAAVNSVAVITAEMLPDYEALLTDSSYQICRTMLNKLMSRFPVNGDRYLEVSKDQYGLSNEIKLDWLEWKFLRGDSTVIPKIIDYSSNAYEFGTRRNAFNVLKRLNYLNDAVIGNLFDAAMSANGGLSGRAFTVTDYFIQQNEMKKRIQKYYYSRTWEDWQRAILQELMN